MDKIKKFFKKIVNKETVLYIVFGVLTTLVNFAAFKLFTMLFNRLVPAQLGVHISNVLAWILAVTFAYITNKLFVFESKSWSGKVLVKEIPSFVAARLFSLGVEELGLVFFVNLLHFDQKSFNIPMINFDLSGEMTAKVILAVVVVILNYFFSKLVIFKKKKDGGEAKNESDTGDADKA